LYVRDFDQSHVDAPFTRRLKIWRIILYASCRGYSRRTLMRAHRVRSEEMTTGLIGIRRPCGRYLGRVGDPCRAMGESN